MNTFWTTFYSYKGGVGRTMALANTAALRVMSGDRVVLIDFDLEAPGLDSYSEFEDAKGKPGVVEYVHHYLETNEVPDIMDYVYECDPPVPCSGKLYVMPAGVKDSEYNRKRNNLDWAQLYSENQGEQFIDNWKAAIENKFNPDHVFIDSRTGLTDVGGICTGHFPDLVVILFGLNEQNINGAAGVSHAIRKTESRKPPRILPVVTPLPELPGAESAARNLHYRRRELTQDSPEEPEPEQDLIRQRLSVAEEKFDLPGTRTIRNFISYYPFAALREEIFFWSHSGVQADHLVDSEATGDESKNIPSAGGAIRRQYKLLAREISYYNQGGFEALRKRTEKIERDVDPDKKNIEKIAKAIRDKYGESRGEAHLLIAKLFRKKGDLGRMVDACRDCMKMEFTEFDKPWKSIGASLYLHADEARTILVNHYTNTNEPESAIKLLDERAFAQRRVYGQEGTIPALRELGLHAMRHHKYRTSAAAFLESYARLQSVANRDIMIECFNSAESIRRMAFSEKKKLVETHAEVKEAVSGLHHMMYAVEGDGLSAVDKKVDEAIGGPFYILLESTVQQFEEYKDQYTQEEPLSCNVLQAIHIAYAMLGDIEKAKECLSTASRIGNSIDEYEDLFCVADYKDNGIDEFLKWNEKMIKALDEKKLWDGMLLEPVWADIEKQRDDFLNDE